MNLVRNYLHAMKQWLPEDRRTEILQDLSEDIQSQIEDRESELGRPVTENEIADLLQQRGHPILFAHKFSPQQYLIGPAWFPIYRFALQALIVWILVPVFLLILGPLAAFASGNPIQAYLGVVGRLVTTSLVTAGVITGVCALLERLQLKLDLFKEWHPRDLPVAPVDPLIDQESNYVSRCGAGFEIIFGLMFILWWVGGIEVSSFSPIRFELTPVWDPFFWPIIILEILIVALATTKLLKPFWRPAYSITNLLIHLSMFAMAILLLQGAPLIAPIAPLTTKALKALQIIETSVQIALVVVTFGAVMTAWQEARRLRAGASPPIGCCLQSVKKTLLH